MIQLGKRYQCASCDAVVLCSKAGDGSLHCCGTQMSEQAPKALPSSD